MLAMHVNCSVDAILFDRQLDFPRGAQSGWIMKILKIYNSWCKPVLIIVFSV